MEQARGKGRAMMALALGGMIVATTGPGIKLAFQNGTGAFELAFYRALLAGVTCLFLCLILPSSRAEFFRLGKSPRLLLWLALAGVSFSAHYLTWVPALKYTSAFVAAALGSTAPVFILIGSALFLKERSRWVAILGILAAVLGVIVTGMGDISRPSGSDAPLGVALALGSAITFAAYSLCSRNARRSVGLLPFLTVLFGVAAVILWAVAWGTGDIKLVKTPFAWGLIVYLGIVCTMGAHGSFNFALRYIKASTVSVATLLEPIGAGVVSFLMFGENPTIWSAIGGLVILCGIGWYFYKDQPLSNKQKTEEKA